MNYSPTKFLTTRQLSRVWLVSEATIKRWADTGQLKSSRTVGGHRRFALAEVMRFQTERGLGAAAGVAPSLHRGGELWYGEEMSVAEEHLATSAATSAVESLAASTRRAGAKAGAAVCCAAEEEMHTMPVLCAQAVLEGAGWDVRNLGGHTPFFALAEYVERQRPALVCVSATLQRELEHNARDYAQLSAAARACG